ncbi:MAG TPA: hypothetical protein VHO01_06405 [Jatrophihabitans sp.]|nr:hypothetical protein [Jatrophihabitans sp.]
MRIPVPGPRDLLRLTEAGYAALEQAIGLVPRAAELVIRIEQLLEQAALIMLAMEGTRERADALVAQVQRTRERADAVVERTETVVLQAAELLASAQQLTGRGDALLAEYEPTLRTFAPIVRRLADTTDPVEVEAVVKLIDTLPHLVRSMDADILPILGTLGTVAPDVRDLLDTMREFNEIVGSLPGLGRIKKRVEERQELQDVQRAEADRSQAGPTTREEG